MLVRAKSYFTGPDGVGRIVASQGREFQTFKVPETSLTPEGNTDSIINTGQDPGFFTTVSCNGLAVHLGIAQIRQSSGYGFTSLNDLF